MDWGALFVVVVLSAGFFGFVLWAAFQSRKNKSEIETGGNTEINFSTIKKRNKQFLNE